MLLNKFLNEGTDFGTHYNVEKPEALSEANWITPDSIGLALIKRMDNSYDNSLSENMMYANTLAEAAYLQGSDPTVLLENAMGDYFRKIVKALKDAWQRMVTWFKNLFKSIAVSMTDIKKALKDVEKLLNGKDFRDFEHDGHEWITNGGGISTSMGVEVTKISTNLSKSSDAIIAKLNKKDITIEGDKNTSYADDQDGQYKNSDTTPDIKTFIGKLVGSSKGSLSIEEAKDIIREKYGYNKTFTSKKGLEWSEMVKFLREFEKNKVLNDAQKKCDENYKTAIKKAEEAVKAAESAKSSVKSDADNVKNSNAYYGARIRQLQGFVTLHKAYLNQYDTLMGTCIDMEKARFSEYRGTISRAIRYNKKKDN